MHSAEKKHWIVKSSGRILGPFSTDNVKQEILNRTISLIDEIQSTGLRWRYIREEQAFVEAVRSLRIEQEGSREDTMTSTLTSQTITQTDTIDLVSENIDIASRVTLKKSDSLTSREKPPKKMPVNPVPQFKAPPKAYGHSQDARVQKSIKKSNSIIWLLSGALILVLGYFAFDKFSKSSVNTFSQGTSFSELYQLGLRAKTLGFYDRALALLKQAERLDPKSNDNNFHVAILEVILEKQTLAGRRKLEAVLTQKSDPTTNAEGYGVIGLSYALEGDMRLASEAYQKSLSVNEGFWQSKYNQSSLEYLQGQYERALSSLAAIPTKPANELLIQLTKAIVNLELAKKDTSYIEAASEVFGFLERSAQKTSEYRQEIYLLLTAYAGFNRNPDKANMYLNAFLESDPYSTDEYIQDLIADKRIVSWLNLKKVCDDALRILVPSARIQAAYALCHIKAGDETRANSYISVAAAQAPKDSLILAISAYLNRETGRDNESRSNLKMSTQLGLSKLNIALQARICETEKSSTCGKEYWSRMLSIDPNSVEAFNGLAWISHNEKNRDQARKNMERGLLISDIYRPLLELRESGAL